MSSTISPQEGRRALKVLRGDARYVEILSRASAVADPEESFAQIDRELRRHPELWRLAQRAFLWLGCQRGFERFMEGRELQKAEAAQASS